MKITILGGTGLIGSKTLPLLQAAGHTIVVASASKGVNVLTGEGVQAALDHADVVIDVLNSPSFDDKPVHEFFQKATANVLPIAKANGVKHYIALSIVGVDLMAPLMPYMHAKLEQEAAIQASGVPYTIVRATQFYEFLSTIVGGHSNNPDGVCRPSSTLMFQPIAASDVATCLADIAQSTPRNGIVDLAGPDNDTMIGTLQTFLNLKGDAHQVVGDEKAGYFGAPIDCTALVPVGAHGEAVIGATHLKEWVAKN
ncbi:hypothetical protein HDU85_001623 [Gaertneriomyces sp. JEL0708]|nr:hypothetical protein HDU85_001623 [Gaertneriomyces sp. JEL0708]